MSAQADVAREVVENGWAILPGVVDLELVGRLNETIERLIQELETPFGSNVFLGERTRRMFNLLSRDRLFEQVPVHEAVLPIIECVLDEECLLSSLTAIEMFPIPMTLSMR